MLELVQELENLIGVSPRFQKQPARKSDGRLSVADVSKAESNLGWRPAVGKEEGLWRMVEWSSQITEL